MRNVECGMRNNNDNASSRAYRADIGRCVKCGSCRAVCPSFLPNARNRSLRARQDGAHSKRCWTSGFPVRDLCGPPRDLHRLSCLRNRLPEQCARYRNHPGRERTCTRASGTGIINRFVSAALSTHDRAMRSLPGLRRRAALRRDGEVKTISDFKDCGSRIETRGARTERTNKSGGSKGRSSFSRDAPSSTSSRTSEARAVARAERAGYEVVVLKVLKCCGRPLLSLGDREAARASGGNRTGSSFRRSRWTRSSRPVPPAA